jgi:hypothetical protein
LAVYGLLQALNVQQPAVQNLCESLEMPRTVNKLLEREKAQLAQTLDRLNARLKEFELRYNMSSQDFYLRFERGELGDDMDLIEWSATWEMAGHARQAFETLQDESI